MKPKTTITSSAPQPSVSPQIDNSKEQTVTESVSRPPSAAQTPAAAVSDNKPVLEKETKKIEAAEPAADVFTPVQVLDATVVVKESPVVAASPAPAKVFPSNIIRELRVL